jgi:hypothetical protein
MPPAGFEHKIVANKRQRTYALDRLATGTASSVYWLNIGQLKISGYHGGKYKESDVL